MAASSSSTTTSNPVLASQVSEKLGKQNHTLWLAQVLTAIRGARLDGHISGKTAAPREELKRKEDGKEGKEIMISNPAFEEWFAKDQQVLGFLFSSVTRDILTQVAGAKTAA